MDKANFPRDEAERDYRRMASYLNDAEVELKVARSRAVPYENEVEISPDGIDCRVVSTDVDFSWANLGRKSAETLVIPAKGGELIETKAPDGRIEGVYVAKAGDAIFVNLHNRADAYVPGNPDGSRWAFVELAARGYAVMRDAPDGEGVIVKSDAKFKVLHEAVKIPSCIRHAWGPGQHQFLAAGATLKMNGNGQVTGIDQAAFDATWEILDRPAPRPMTGEVIPRNGMTLLMERMPGLPGRPTAERPGALPAAAIVQAAACADPGELKRIRGAIAAAITPDVWEEMGYGGRNIGADFAFEKVVPRFALLGVEKSQEIIQAIEANLEGRPDPSPPAAPGIG